jgi:hypothetical protein
MIRCEAKKRVMIEVLCNEKRKGRVLAGTGCDFK